MREDIVKALKEYDRSPLNKKETIKVENLLKNDETVFFISHVSMDIINVNNKEDKISTYGTVILTNKRFIFNYQPLFNDYTETFSLYEIKSINSYKKTLGYYYLELQTLTKIYNMSPNISKEMIPKLSQAIEQAKSNPAAETTPKANTSDNKILADIEKLAGFRDQKIITEEEFQAKKRELLLRL